MPTSLAQERTYWEAQVDTIRRTQLSSVQKSAAVWAGLLSTLLGVFGVVAFAGGLQTIDKFDASFGGLLRLLTTAAVVFDVLGIISLGVASGGLIVRKVATLTGSQLQNLNAGETNRALGFLAIGRILACLAATAVLSGSGMVLWAPAAPAATDSYVVQGKGVAACGPLTGTATDLKVGSVELSRTSSIIPVSSCPTK